MGTLGTGGGCSGQDHLGVVPDPGTPQGHHRGVPPATPRPPPGRCAPPGWAQGLENALVPGEGAAGRGSLPGVDAVFPAEGVFDREAPVVELQGGEAALIQAHHLAVAQGIRLGAVPCGTGAQPPSTSPSTPQRGCCDPSPCPDSSGGSRRGSASPGAGGGTAWGPPRAVGSRRGPVPGAISTAASSPLCLLNEEPWIFPTI